MSEILNLSKKIGIWLASIHSIAYVITISEISSSNDPQAYLLLIVFMFIDFPVSLLYFLVVSENTSGTGLFLPTIIHGILGGLWWYFLPRLVIRRKKRNIGIRLGSCINYDDKT